MDSMDNKDLAKKEHWDSIYAQESSSVGWKPYYYDSLCIEKMLLDAVQRYKPKTVLEIGCGNSIWMGYLQQKTGVQVAGMDYSEKGCELARKNLHDQGVTAEVFCADMFTADPETIGTYDMIFSLGVVEHFEDLEHVLRNMSRFLKPGGVMVTEIPNLRSVIGFIDWVWQPELFYKHKLISRKALARTHEKAGLKSLRSYYHGIFSLLIISWGTYHRFRFYKKLVPLMQQIAGKTDQLLRKRKRFTPGTAMLSPFVVTEAVKPN